MCNHDKKMRDWEQLELSKIKQKIRTGIKGVYIIKTNLPFRRLKGRKCQILYIGEGNLRIRLKYLANSKIKKTDSHVASKRFKEYYTYYPKVRLEFYYKVINNKQKRKHQESKLIKNYEKEHLEVPPFNHKG